MTDMDPHIHDIIQMAWCDKTSFDDTQRMTGKTEAEVIMIMRTHLKRQSFKRWRQRVTGRAAKHRDR